MAPAVFKALNESTFLPLTLIEKKNCVFNLTNFPHRLRRRTPVSIECNPKNTLRTTSVRLTKKSKEFVVVFRTTFL